MDFLIALGILLLLIPLLAVKWTIWVLQVLLEAIEYPVRAIANKLLDYGERLTDKHLGEQAYNEPWLRPPIHPNCRCKVVEFKAREDERTVDMARGLREEE